MAAGRFDVIVIGAGGMGSAALWHVARRGMKVLGLDPFGVAHDRGSSHGSTRLIRRAYFEHPDYVPLLDRAYALWGELEGFSGRRLYFRTGLLLVGPGDRAVLTGVRRAAAAHRLDIDELSADEVRKRFPGLEPADEMEALFEADAGYLPVEECVRAQIEQATALGAGLALGAAVREWSAGNGEVTVRTDGGDYRAGALVLCAGAWTGRLVPELRHCLEVRRKVMLWYRAQGASYAAAEGVPVVCFDTDKGFYYAFPAINDDGVKVGEHSGGAAVADPDLLDRALHGADREPVERFMAVHLPQLSTDLCRHSVCTYTMTPDEHFIIDRHPEHGNVVIAAGFSGHGFKFAPLVGSVAADLVIDGKTEEPIAFLSARRFRGR